ncbi:uncharacterized protein RHO17_000965 [Thomomys bottae]
MFSFLLTALLLDLHPSRPPPFSTFTFLDLHPSRPSPFSTSTLLHLHPSPPPPFSTSTLLDLHPSRRRTGKRRWDFAQTRGGWAQPEIHTKEEIIELLVLEQYLNIVPDRLQPWVRAGQPESCEELVVLLETHRMYQREDDANGNGDMRWNGEGASPTRPAPSSSSE